MKLLDLMAIFHNWLCDKDFLWWPFSFLRPARTEIMTWSHVLLMTACFGGLTFLMFTFFAVANNVFSAKSCLLTFIMCFGFFLLWFSVVTKPLWNRRARGLLK